MKDHCANENVAFINGAKSAQRDESFTGIKLKLFIFAFYVFINGPSVKYEENLIDFSRRRCVSIRRRKVRRGCERNLGKRFVRNESKCNWVIREIPLGEITFIDIKSFEKKLCKLILFVLKSTLMSLVELRLFYQHETNNHICIILCLLKPFPHEKQTSMDGTFLPFLIFAFN